ncbi:MAG TPA: M20/M25/M40 family metallo-hydrolase [Gemmatimonadales bacterium]|nr:M20/M25/M40 family metallo-hydrolase [Gemmatimonadales bacterium]
MRTAYLIALLPLIELSPAAAQERVDLDVIARIREEGFQRSRVMDFAWVMTDVLGPRLTGSPGERRAQRWARARMDSLGLVNTAIEPFGEHGVGWTNEYTSLHLLAPSYQPIIGYPQAFTPGTGGKITGEARVVSIRSSADFAQYRGKLKGAIVLSTRPREVRPNFAADASRFSDDSLATLGRVTLASRYQNGGVAQEWNDAIRTFLPVGSHPTVPGFDEEVLKFLKAEGVGVVLEAGGGSDGTVFLTGRAGNRQDRSEAAVLASPPVVTLAAEHYNRIYRLATRGVPTRLEVEVRNALDNSDTKGYNVLGEWRGTDLDDQVVMIGGHFDSWAQATGATDDAAGCAVLLEAIRILKAVGATPRRTIRVGFWSWEEGGVNGSRAYVKNHPELRDKLAAYFNLDNGSGRIRGIYLQGNEAVRPIFTSWLAPFADLQATTVTAENEFGVDAIAFDLAGLPGFQFIQDPLDYETRTHHSNMDVYDKLVPEDLRRNAVIMATFIYNAAMRDLPLPRETPEAR